MKYIPLFGEDAKHREFTGKHWNKKYIRAIQSILNVTKGIVAPAHRNEKTSFFDEAFGKNIDEFYKILYMPETYIVYRHIFRYKLGYTTIWEEEYGNLSDVDRKIAHKIIEGNVFTDEEVEKFNSSEMVESFLRHYKISRKDIDGIDKDYKKLKSKFDKLIKEDPFINLTLTYDFENEKARKVHRTLV